MILSHSQNSQSLWFWSSKTSMLYSRSSCTSHARTTWFPHRRISTFLQLRTNNGCVSDLITTQSLRTSVVCPSVSLHYPSSLSIIGRIKNQISQIPVTGPNPRPTWCNDANANSGHEFHGDSGRRVGIFQVLRINAWPNKQDFSPAGNIKKSREIKVSKGFLSKGFQMFPKVSNGFQKMSKGFQMFPKVPNVSKGFQRFPRNCCTIAWQIFKQPFQPSLHHLSLPGLTVQKASPWLLNELRHILSGPSHFPRQFMRRLVWRWSSCELTNFVALILKAWP